MRPGSACVVCWVKVGLMTQEIVFTGFYSIKDRSINDGFFMIVAVMPEGYPWWAGPRGNGPGLGRGLDFWHQAVPV